MSRSLSYRSNGGVEPGKVARHSQDASTEAGLPIAWLLPLVLAGLVLATVVPVALLGFLGARDNTNRLLRDRSELVLDVVVDRVAAHLDPVRAQLSYAAEAVSAGTLDTRDMAAMTSYLAGSLAGVSQVNGLAYVRPDGTVQRHNRASGRSFEESVESLSAVRQSVADNRVDPGLRWVGPVWSPSLRQPILAARIPLKGPADEDRGLLVATVSVAELSRSLAAMANDVYQTPFILVGRDHVLAHPALVAPDPETRPGPDQPLPAVEGFRDGVLSRMWTRPARTLSFGPFRASQGHWSWLGDGSFEANAYVYRAVADYGATPWIVGVHFPSADTRRERWIVLGIGIGGLALLLLSLGAAVLMARRLSRPVLGLAAAAARVQTLDFAGARTIPRGPVREINEAAAAVERMAEGLSWFETYLPKTLVRRLMAAGSSAALTETRTVTIMFTDLERYSVFSSSRPATEVVSYLNELLARIGPIIEESGGTIDKYIGDGVMAFWGAPDDRPDHAPAACQAACAIAREVTARNSDLRARGLHACRMRVGLHTGAVAVGNVGFSGRVDYTVVGRAVNLAQRIEQSGRAIVGPGEVVILASAATMAAAGPSSVFELRPEIDVDDSGSVFQLMPGPA